MKGNFSEILEKYCLKRRYAHNFRKFRVSYVLLISEILQQIFHNFTNMLKKSEKLKKIKFLCSTPSLPSHYNPSPSSPHPHNGNLSACEWKISHLHHAATVSLIVCTAPPPLPSTSVAFFIMLQFSYGTLCCNFKDISRQKDRSVH